MDEVKSIYGAACKHPTLRLLQLDNNINSSSSKDVDAVVDTPVVVINATTTATGNVSKRVRISNSNYTDKDDPHHPHQHQHVDRVSLSSSSSSEMMKSKYIVPSQMRSMMDIDQLLHSSYQFGLDLRDEIHKLEQVSKEGSSLID